MSQNEIQQDVTVVSPSPQPTSESLSDPEPNKDDFGGEDWWDGEIRYFEAEKGKVYFGRDYKHLSRAQQDALWLEMDRQEKQVRSYVDAWQKTPEYQKYKTAHREWSERKTRRESPIENAKYRTALASEVKAFYDRCIAAGRADEWIKKVGIPSRHKAANLFDLGSDNQDYRAAADALLTMIELPHGPPYESASTANPHAISDMFAIIGPRGTGKTWLACALLILSGFTAIKRHGLYHIYTGDKPPIYRRAADIFTDVKASFGSRETSQREILQKLAEAPLLVIDEIQERSGTDFEDVLLVNLIDKRYGERRPTVLISNCELSNFAKSVGDSVMSRLQECGGIIQATWPSFRAR